MTFMSGGGGGGAGGTLPTGVNQNWLESQGGSTNIWQPSPQELLSNLLLNVTSTGDAGNRADHFLGSSLNPKWTLALGTVSSRVGNSVLSIRSTVAAGASAYYTQPYTPSGTYEVRMRVRNACNGTTSSVGLSILDAATPEAAGSHSIIIFVDSGANMTIKTDTQTAGVFTGIGTVTLTGRPEWIYLRLFSTVANQWNADYSFDGSQWVSLTSASSFTFTPAVIGIYASSNGAAATYYSVDYIDVAA